MNSSYPGSTEATRYVSLPRKVKSLFFGVDLSEATVWKFFDTAVSDSSGKRASEGQDRHYLRSRKKGKTSAKDLDSTKAK